METLKRSQIEVINLFRRNIFLSKTIREISFLVKKDYPNVHRAVKELEKMGVLKLQKIGKALVCKIALSERTISILSFLDEQESFSKKIPNIERILAFNEFFDDIILITGSYAKGKENKKSDIDLVIITKDNPLNKQKLIENLIALFLPKIHAVVISYKDFVDMLLSEEENYGKEIFKNRFVFRNAKRYYVLIREAISHGFGG